MKENTLISIPEELVKALKAARSVTVLTGAGISAESGIPTFRDAQTGLWAHYDPHELATHEAFTQNPELVMDWYRWRRSLVEKASPNQGHYALATMEQHIDTFTLVTQNVDGLHVRAGSKNVVTLHGSMQRLRCSNASCDYTTSEWPAESVANCPKCGALLRPDVVWFGERLPEKALETALQASRTCEIFFSIGTSGVVEPAASLPYEALRSGAVMVEVNPQPTPLSVYSKFEFNNPAGEVLSQIVSAVWG